MNQVGGGRCPPLVCLCSGVKGPPTGRTEEENATLSACGVDGNRVRKARRTLSTTTWWIHHTEGRSVNRGRKGDDQARNERHRQRRLGTAEVADLK